MYTTIREQLLALIAEITLHPKPSYTIDGQSVEWTAYLKQLQESAEWCEKQAAREEPCEVISRGLH